MRTTSVRTSVSIAIASLALFVSFAPAKETGAEPSAGTPAPAPAEEARASQRWKRFREHVEKLGRKDLLPEETAGARAPSVDAIAGILFHLSSDLAAAHELLEKEPADAEGARARLKKLEGTEDPYLADYAALLTARCDLAKKDFPAAARGFEKVLDSSRNLAAAEARRGLAESYRGMGETTLETLELRFLVAALPAERSADRNWAEERLAEIRRDHAGPLEDSAKRMRSISTRLATAENGQSLAKDQKEVEDILLKVAKLLEDEAKRCLLCSSTACKACQKCGACTASGMCEGEHTGPGLVKGTGRGQRGDPRNGKQGGPAQRTSVAKEKPGEKDLRDPAAKDADAWGSINDREVAKALQDLWGKIPPSYRQTVAAYFKDISGLKSGAPPAPADKPAAPAPAGGR